MKTTKKILNDWVCEEIPAGICELSIVITNDLEIQELNRTYRRKDKPTDVLSFPQITKDKFSLLSRSLGDIVISLDTAKRQAKKFGVTLNNELTRLLVHSLLHLLGYDHEGVSKAEANRMRRKEKKIMEALI